MIRGRTRRTGELDFFDDTAPATVVASVTPDGVTGAAGGEVTSEDITDATDTGRAVLTAEDAAAARTAIGAGTSDLELGATSTTALAGNDSRLTAGAAGTATVRAIGATATTAAAGNHVHTATQVTATAITPGTATNVQGILAELAARITALETP